jgi:hypothetical protein
MSFPHSAAEIGEVFENQYNEICTLLNGATEILYIFSECFS